jgi:hypothetical protein
MSGPHIELIEFVSRVGHDELWLVDAGLYTFCRCATASTTPRAPPSDFSTRRPAP